MVVAVRRQGVWVGLHFDFFCCQTSRHERLNDQNIVPTLLQRRAFTVTRIKYSAIAPSLRIAARAIKGLFHDNAQLLC